MIGPNGAGKTTLINQLSGEIVPDAGSIRFDGRDITAEPVYRRALLGLGRSYQITSVFPEFSVLVNVMLAVQAHAGHSFSFWRPVPTRRELVAQRARSASTQVGLAGQAGAPVAALAHGERRQLEMAMTLATHPKLLLLDEPMAGMSLAESERLVALLASLKGRYGILLVEHDMDAVFKLADRISVLVYGRVDRLRRPGGDPRQSRRARRVSRRAGPGGLTAMALLEVDGLTAFYGTSQVLFGMAFAAEAGQCITLIGRNGMGKTTTVKSVIGMLPTHRGDVRFDGQAIGAGRRIASRRPASASCRRCARSFRRSRCARTSWRRARAARPRRSPWTLERVYALFPRLQERASHLGSQLSGGEQQMLAIGRALMTNPRLLILDEATEGLAPLVRAEIWKCLATLKREGLTLIVIDKNIGPLARLADRHYIVEKGRIAWHGDSDGAARRSARCCTSTSACDAPTRLASAAQG